MKIPRTGGQLKQRGGTWLVISLIALAFAPGALAADEQGDAGDVPATAQDLTRAPVDSITGTIATGNDADLYRVCLTGEGSFSATTVGLTDVDTQLFLFDATGLGIYAHDDGTTKQSTLPAEHPLTPSASGEYILGISAYDRDPQSSGGPIFSNVAFVTPANGRGAGAPVESWAGLPRDSGGYTVALTGTRSCDVTPPVVDLRSPVDGDSVPLGAEVVVDYSCGDEGGSELASCEGSVPDGATLDTSTLGSKTVTVTARDGAGNETTASATIEVVDETTPTVEVRTPEEGASYAVGEEVFADYECSDEPGGSGLVSCVGDVRRWRGARHRDPGQQDLHGHGHRRRRQHGDDHGRLRGPVTAERLQGLPLAGRRLPGRQPLDRGRGRAGALLARRLQGSRRARARLPAGCGGRLRRR